MKPHFLVHMTYASKSDLHKAAQKTRGIVVCPRANSSLAEGNSRCRIDEKGWLYSWIRHR